MSETHHKPLTSAALTGATLGRLLMVRSLTKKISKGESIGGISAAIAIVDVMDGVIARRLGVDGLSRRAADGTVDKITIGSALIAGARHKPELQMYSLPLLGRELFVAAGSLKHYLSTGEIARGGNVHKLASLSVAAFAVSAMGNNERAADITGTLAVVANGALAIDYVSKWQANEAPSAS